MKLTEYQEMQDIIVTIERLVSHINEELNKFPTDFVENHLEKIYILGDDVLSYVDDSKNGRYATFDAILFQRPFPFFKYRCRIRWGCAFRRVWIRVDNAKFYSDNIILSKLDKVSLLKLTIVLNDIYNRIKGILK